MNRHTNEFYELDIYISSLSLAFEYQVHSLSRKICILLSSPYTNKKKQIPKKQKGRASLC